MRVGAASFLFEVNDKGTAVIKKITGTVSSQMKKMASASSSATRKISAGWGRVKTSMSKGWGKVTAMLKGMVGQLIAVYGAYRLVSGVFNFFKEAIELSNVQIAAITKLENALGNMGFAVNEVSADFQTYASALQLQTGIGDEVILSQMGMMSAFGGTQKEIKQATQAALDMSAVVGTDLKATAMLMGRALAGNVSLFSRYGITIDMAKYKVEGFNAVLDALTNFMGAAAAQGRTYAGAMKRLSAAWGDYKEQVGDSITKNYLVAATIDTIVNRIGLMTGTLKEGTQAYDDMVTRGMMRVFDWGQKLTKFIAFWSLAWETFKAVIYSVLWVLLKLAKAISYVAQGAALTKNISKDFRDSFTNFRNDIDGMTGTLGNGVSVAVDDMGKAFEKMKGGSQYLNELKGGAIETAKAFKKMADEAKESGKFAKPKVEDFADEAKKTGGGTEAAWKVPTDPKQFWGEFATNQQALTSPKSDWAQQEQAFTRLQAMFARVDDMASSTSQKIRASFTALGAGIQTSVNRGNTYLQSMAEMGQNVAEQLRGGFENIFFNAMKGNFSDIGSLFKDLLNGMLDAFIKMLAQMMVQKMMSGVLDFFTGGVGGIIGGLFGGLFANGGYLGGQFTPLRAMASGGAVTSPTLGLIGEGRYNEAVVPLPDGKSIPVQMNGGGGGDVHVTIQNVLDANDVVGKVARDNPNLIVNPVVADYGNRGPMHKVISRGGK